MLRCKPTSQWPYNEACHMFADTLDELHRMAVRLGLRHAWFQEPVYTVPHYDLTRKKRELAIQLGAEEITRQEYRERFMYVRQHE
jgi:hypothetical protein